MIYLPDPTYNPQFRTIINENTLLDKSSSIGRFLVNTGEFYDFESKSLTDKQEIARNLILQVNAVNIINLRYDGFPFRDYRLVVSEGLYKPSANETLSEGSVNSLRTKGRAIVYELYDSEGNLNIEKTFELVNFMKNACRFDKLILDYDTYESSLHASIIITTPQVSINWKATFKQEIHTQYNNVIQTTGEFVEIKG